MTAPTEATIAAAGAAVHDGADDAGLSDLDHALADWARRHGAEVLVARAFALANRAVSRGHTCLALDAIPTALMSVDDQRALPAALADSTLVGGPGDVCPLVLDGGRLYLQRYHAYEVQLAERLRSLMTAPPAAVDPRRLQPGHGLFTPDAANPAATNWQAVAAFVALRHRFAVVSGGPGTGKTYTILRLLRVLIETALGEQRRPPHVALAAPTGKAAAGMLDSIRTGLEAMAGESTFDPAIEQYMPHTAHTLHRLLGLAGNTTRARFNAGNPLPADVVIIDEASMVDLPMMAKLADAIGNQTRLILLGDRYQLASVESGSVLADICARAGVNQFTSQQQTAAAALLTEHSQTTDQPLGDHVVTLQTSRRFNADSAIGRFAAAVNAGDAATAHALLGAEHPELAREDNTGPDAIARLLARSADHYAPLAETDDPAAALRYLGRHCVLAAVRSGPLGSAIFNARIIALLAERHDFNPAHTWFHGRPVMVTRNDYRLGLFNGDIGIALRNHAGDLRIWFHGDGGPRSFLPGTLPAHDSAYAMTIHKSQGSEFDAVTLLLPDYDVPILTRELIYTGATRARHRLVLHARENILNHAIRRRVARHSRLAERLSNHAGE